MLPFEIAIVNVLKSAVSLERYTLVSSEEVVEAVTLREDMGWLLRTYRAG